jgi:hypothetical protein
MAQSQHTYRVEDEHFHHDVATHAPILNSEEARQGVVSGRVMTILAVSLTLSVAALVVLLAAIV